MLGLHGMMMRGCGVALFFVDMYHMWTELKCQSVHKGCAFIPHTSACWCD